MIDKFKIIKIALISVFYIIMVIAFLMLINTTFDNSFDEYGYYQSDRDYVTHIEENKLND